MIENARTIVARAPQRLLDLIRAAAIKQPTPCYSHGIWTAPTLRTVEVVRSYRIDYDRSTRAFFDQMGRVREIEAAWDRARDQVSRGGQRDRPIDYDRGADRDRPLRAPFREACEFLVQLNASIHTDRGEEDRARNRGLAAVCGANALTGFLGWADARAAIDTAASDLDPWSPPASPEQPRVEMQLDGRHFNPEAG